jgi:membrane-associated phospholipid phosphatase
MERENSSHPGPRRRHWFIVFLGRRFSRDEYLGLHLTAGMLLSLATLGLFLFLGHNVLGDTRLNELDHEFGRRLEAHRLANPALRTTFGVITQFGALNILFLLGLLVALILFMRRQRLLTVIWLTTLVGVGLLNSVMKASYDRPRPPFLDPVWVHEANASFPSGHSLVGFVGYGFLAYLLLLDLPKKVARWVASALGMLILAIGFSRMYLGAHYASDVAGGFAVGFCWLAAVISGIEVVRRRRRALQKSPLAAERAQTPARVDR